MVKLKNMIWTEIYYSKENICTIKKKRKRIYHNGILEYEGEYLYDKKYNGKELYKNRNIIYELKNGNGKVEEYVK